MRVCQVVALGVGLSILTVGTASRVWAAPIVVDFEQFTGMGPNYDAGLPIPPASRLSDQLLSTYGVLFSSGSPYVAVIDLKAGHAPSGINGIGGSTAAGNISYDTNSPITFSFWDPKNTSVPATTDFVSVRGDFQPITSQTATFSAYNLQNQLILSVTHNDLSGQVWALSVPGIHSAVWSGIAPPGIGGIALDDLTFDAVTPEPSTIGFLGFALATVLVRPGKRHSAR